MPIDRRRRTLELERYLDGTERQMVNKPIVQIAEYRGDLDAGALARAFDLLSFDFPVIRARVTPDDDRLLLQVPPGAGVTTGFLAGGLDELRAELRQSWKPGDGVARLLVVTGDRHGYVALRMDHSVITGPSWTAIFARLWTLYTHLVTGRDVTVSAIRSGTLPMPPSAVFRSVLGDRYTRTEQYTEAAVSARQFVVRLEEQSTRDFLAAARELGTTVHALTCGVVLRALRDRADTDQPARMTCFTVANLQKRSPLGLGVTDTTTPLVWHRADVTVDHAADPAVIGRAVKWQLDRALQTRDLPDVDASALVDSTIDQRLAKVMVTNIGIVERFEQPPALEIVDWFRLYEVTSPFPWYAGYTYDGRYHLICVYPATTYTQVEVESLGAEVGSLLGRLASTSGRRPVRPAVGSAEFMGESASAPSESPRSAP
ncbi:phthiocerol/phthiodiolone dimycocerosyl transferase family protein [Jiangella aurantiaca]|uniref:phthiocerol/phthiodiolone dimycocerosyl transferase family protein n=1 Tax=Jiangella aurantiaca TaxID=2530373 RepID=UPI0013A5EDF2|nr:hypothetical protein [Jiangella aurantiaca]